MGERGGGGGVKTNYETMATGVRILVGMMKLFHDYHYNKVSSRLLSFHFFNRIEFNDLSLNCNDNRTGVFIDFMNCQIMYWSFAVLHLFSSFM